MMNDTTDETFNEDVQTEEVLSEEEAMDQEEAALMEELEAKQTALFEASEETSDLDFSDVEECQFPLDLRRKVIESVLFISDKPVSMTTLITAFGATERKKPLIAKEHIQEALDQLEDELEEQDRGFRLTQVNGGFQLRTTEDMKDYLQNTIKARSFRLTGPSLETLAMIAYKQPCTKSQIDEIRGVDSSHLVRALMDKGIVSFAGKSELPGKPMLYKTTQKFLEIFGLRNLRELPGLSEIEALLPNGIGDEEEEDRGTLAELAGKISENFDGSYSASEEELGKITDQLSDITTSSDFFEQEKQREKDRREAEKAENIREAMMVGEDVSTRDQNWLVRYDERMNPVEEEGEGEAVAESREDTTSDESTEETLLATDEQVEDAELEMASENDTEEVFEDNELDFESDIADASEDVEELSVSEGLSELS